MVYNIPKLLQLKYSRTKKTLRINLVTHSNLKNNALQQVIV